MNFFKIVALICITVLQGCVDSEFKDGSCVVADDGYIWKINRTEDGSVIAQGWLGSGWGNEVKLAHGVLNIERHTPSDCPALSAGVTDQTSGSIKWYVWTLMPSKNEVAERHINLGSFKIGVSVKLVNGWVCEVGSASINDARQTVCRKENDEVAFSVQCDQSRQNDHIQLRFKNSSDNNLIEVGCKTNKQ